MRFDKETVEYTARLARIELSSEQILGLSTQLNNIIKYIEQLNQVDTSKVEPTSHVLPLENVYREDKVKSSLPPEDVLKNAPEKEGNFFKVPKVIE